VFQLRAGRYEERYLAAARRTSPAAADAGMMDPRLRPTGIADPPAQMSPPHADLQRLGLRH
jgi:hypothetical protein